MRLKTEEDLDRFIASIEHKYTPEQLRRIRLRQQIGMNIMNRRSAPLNGKEWTILDTANMVRLATHLYKPGADRWIELLYDYNRFYLARYMHQNKHKLPQKTIEQYNDLIRFKGDNKRMLVT